MHNQATRQDFVEAPNLDVQVKAFEIEETETIKSVEAYVKWFNVTKGFGFVQPGDGMPDAFLHASILEKTGHRSLPEGSLIVCDLEEGNKGLQVLTIHDVTHIPSPPPPLMQEKGVQIQQGKIKFFNGDKGYGFITLDDNPEQDVFVSARVLERSAILDVKSGTAVRLKSEQGKKGLLATVVELVEDASPAC